MHRALPAGQGRSLLPLLGGRDGDVGWEDVAFCEYCTDEGWYTRMIRSGPWKLNYYHGHEPQLFNLALDPHELDDRARDPACRAVRQELTERVIQRWRPEEIARRDAPELAG